MKRYILLLFVFITIGSVNAQNNRGFKPVNVVGASPNGNLYDYSYALVIGEVNYINGWQRLDGVKIDITQIKSALEQNGFFVVLKQDLTSEQLTKTINDFIADYGQNENTRLLIYYAGHGHTIKNNTTNRQMGYIVPVDAPNPYTDMNGFLKKAVSMNNFKTYAYNAQAKHVLFMFDACFAGTVFSSRAGVPPAISYNTSKPVRQFITSGSADETVPDESVFRELFVRALTSNVADGNNDGFVTGSELGSYLQDNVINYNNGVQHPKYGKILDPTLDEGDFVFVLNDSLSSAPSQVVVQQQFGTLKLITEISGDFFLETELISPVIAGNTYNFNNVAEGIRVLTIKNSNGTQLWQIKTYVTTGQITNVKAEQLAQYGILNLVSDNIEGNVFIDGTQRDFLSRGSTVSIQQIEVGNHTVEIQSRGKILWSSDFIIIVNNTSNLTAKVSQNNIDIDEPEMIFVKGGTFQMGSNNGDADEKPAHTVSVSDFYIGKYEITVAQFKSFIDATNYLTDAEKLGKSYVYDGSWYFKNGVTWQCDIMGNVRSQSENNCPVIHVSWNDAVEYCNWLSQVTGHTYRLPTEAEWEYAARGGKHSKGYKYAGSNDVNAVAWYVNNANMLGNSNRKFGVSRVGAKSPNELGIFDMSGNVWEWCNDWYAEDYYQNSPKNNPQGALTGSYRVLRGGSWGFNDYGCRITKRIFNSQQNLDSSVGFRICRTNK